MKHFTIPSSADGAPQDVLYKRAEMRGPRPLVVALHTWSYHCDHATESMETVCTELGCDLICPDFRGPNTRPESCGSKLVVADIVDARDWAIAQSEVDLERVYLIGGSGGGHATMLVAGRARQGWAAASAWCGISDLLAWHAETSAMPKFRDSYPHHIEVACGGDIHTNLYARMSAQERSPITWLEGARNLPLDINAGIHDGHTGSVPVSQSIRAYNLLAAPEDRVPEEDIRLMTKGDGVPEHLRWQGTDPCYRDFTVLYRRASRNVRLTLFEGRHEMVRSAAFAFLLGTHLGQTPNWEPHEDPGVSVTTASLNY